MSQDGIKVTQCVMQIKLFKQEQLSIRRTFIANIMRFATERPRKNCSKQKLYENACNYKQCKVAGRVARNSQWGWGLFWGSGGKAPGA